MADIFLSHSSADNDAADRIKSWLARDRGSWSVFLDKHQHDGILAGQGWQDRLRSELESCRLVLAVVTPAWLASRWCFTEAVTATFRGKDFVGVTIGDVPREAIKKTAPPIVHERQRQPLNLATGAGWDELLYALDRSGLDPSRWFPIPDGVGPYPGFVAFEERDAGVFFGRDREITRYLDELNLLRAPNRAQALVIAGGSGSGKSSLLKAGLIPRLRQGAHWLILPPFDPSREPIHALFSGLRTAAQSTASEIDLPPQPPQTVDGLAELLQNALRTIEEKADTWLLLPLDQAEVLLAGTQTGNNTGASRLLDAVGRLLAGRTRRLVAVLTIRTEFMPALERTLPAEVGLDVRSLRLLTALSEVIEKPAARFGIGLEDGLTARMVEDTRGADALPLLAYSLRELNEHYGGNKLLKVSDYERLGGVEGVIEKKLREAFSDPSPTAEELSAFRRCFVRQLVRVDESGVEGERYLRTAVARDAVPRPARRLVARLQEARLLVGGDDGTIGIAHEHLIRNWSQVPLKTWLVDDSDDRKLIDNLKSFLAAHEDGGPLLSEKPLVDAKDFLQRDPPLRDDEPELAQFIDASVTAAQRRQRRQRWLFRGTVAASVVFLAVAAGAVRFYLEAQQQTRVAKDRERDAEEQRRVAEEQKLLAETERDRANRQRDEALRAESRRLSARADNQLGNGEVEAAIESALAAVTGGAGPEPPYSTVAVETLLRTLDPYRDALFTVQTSLKPYALLPNRSLLFASPDGVLTVDLSTGKRLVDRRLDGSGNYISVDPSGEFVAVSGERGTSILDLRSDEPPVQLHADDPYWHTLDAAFGPDNEFVVVSAYRGQDYLFRLPANDPPRVADRRKLFDEDTHALRVAVSPDGKRLAALSLGGLVRLVEIVASDEGELRFGTSSDLGATKLDIQIFEVDERTSILVSDNAMAFVEHGVDKSTIETDRVLVFAPLNHSSDSKNQDDISIPEPLTNVQSSGPEVRENGKRFSENSAYLRTYDRRGKRFLHRADKHDIQLLRVGHRRHPVLVQTLRHPSVITANFDPEGNRVITTADGTTIVWNVAEPRQQLEYKLDFGRRTDCNGSVLDAFCRADRQSILTAKGFYDYGESNYCVWDPALDDPITLKATTGFFESVELGRDAPYVVVKDPSGSRFYDTRTGALLEQRPRIETTASKKRDPEPTAIKAVAPSGAAVSYEDGHLRFVDGDGLEIASRVVEKPLGAPLFSPSGDMLVTRHRGPTRVWSPLNGELIDLLIHGVERASPYLQIAQESQALCAAFAAENELLTVDSAGKIHRWRLGEFRAAADMVDFARKRLPMGQGSGRAE